MKYRSIVVARHALRGVALAAACLVGSHALALGLGRLSVQSALGENLRAEVEIVSITPEEAASLRLRVAPPEAFRAAGIDYNPALATAQVSIQRRADGRQVVRINGDRAVLEPFVDVILEASWSSGRLVREYTMLFDPPASRLAAPPPAVTTAPVIAAAPVPTTPLPQAAPPAPAVAAPPRPAPAPAAAPRPAATEAPRPAVAATPPAAPSADGTPDQVVVKPGDSLSGIAQSRRHPGVSLDQMLVSLFRGNPQAFTGDNMNRLRAGAVLSVPSAEQAGSVSQAEARQLIVAQAADFDAYRQRLASGVPAAAEPAATRQAAGQVQAQVEDRRQQAAPGPDRLTLSQGAVKASAPEARIARDAQAKDEATRLAELSRNVEELKKLQGAASSSVAQAAPAAAVAAAAPAAPAAQTAAPAPAASPAPAPAAPPAAEPSPRATAPLPAPESAPAEPGWLDALLQNPLVLPGAGVLVALLAGLGIYRLRGRQREPAGETSFLESRLQPDSFFGAAGGQRVDTREAPASASPSSSSSTTYSLSQLDAIGDVDPVAEADVYLAYGRDLQAEEILKEAMRATPDRLAIRSKLLEVYAKRRDARAFELMATQVFTMTRGAGEEWSKAQELGRQVDPENPLYAPGGAPELSVDATGRVVEPLDATTMPHTAKAGPASFQPAADATLGTPSVDLDLDLGAAEPAAAATEATRPLPPVAQPTVGGDSLPFDLPGSDASTTAPGALTVEVDRKSDFGALDFDLSELPGEPARSAAPPPTAPDRIDLGLDFGDLGGPEEPTPSMLEDGDPLARKIELAEEFRQIGDLEGARDLLEEVVAKADGALKAKAQGMLASLG
ncbi:MAG: hypothetical protein MUF03_10415 [Rubrivivax sp.]|nr:hypothetical protein [Rubrivivax sp.]